MQRNKKRRSISLDCLGKPALLQLQTMGVDVSKQLAAKSGQHLISQAPRTNKFGVSPADQRTEDNVVFSSKLEASCYRFLRDRQIPFDRQKPFVLEGEFEHEGKKYRPVTYVCDFVVGPLVLDMKGVITPMYRLKEKLMLKKHGIKVQRVKSLNELALLLHDHGLLVPPRNEHPSQT